jgi:hypothetical protein
MGRCEVKAFDVTLTLYASSEAVARAMVNNLQREDDRWHFDEQITTHGIVLTDDDYDPAK